jgi:hypothetical protein
MTLRLTRSCIVFAVAIGVTGVVRPQGKALIVESRPDHITVDYYPAPHPLTPVQIGGRTYVAFPDAEASTETLTSASGLPIETFIIGIPPEGTPSVEVLNSTSDVQQQVVLAHQISMGVTNDKEQRVERNYVPMTTPPFNGTAASAQPAVRISRVSLFRYQRIAVIEVHPYGYNPSTNILTRYTSIRLRITLPANSSGRVVADPHFESSYKTLLLNYAQAKQWRTLGSLEPDASSTNIKSAQAEPNYNWFIPGQQYYKAKIASDGIYTIRYTDIQNLGLVPESVDPRNIEIFYKGVSLPLHVVGEADGQFNQNDTVEFFGRKLYDASGLTNEFSDTSVYWLTFQGQNAPRAEIDSVPVPNPSVRADYYNAATHVEQNVFYYYGDQGLPNNNQTAKIPGEGWYWSTIFAGNTYSYNVPLSNVYTPGNPSFQLTFKVHSSVYNQATPNHILTILVNDTTAGTDSLSGYQDRAIVVTAPVSRLKSANNVVKLTSVKTAASLSDVLVDWLELKVPQYYRAKNDSIMFIPDRITVGQTAKFVISSFLSDTISVYRLDTLGGIEKYFIVNPILSGGSYVITFTDTIAAGRRYFALAGRRKRQSPSFVPRTFVDLRSASLGADYLIVTAPDFLSDANRLAAYRSQTGVGRTRVILFGDIQDEFGFGFFDPAAIRRFLLAADSLWTPPRPSYVLFFGDANWDYKNFLKANRTNYVPSYGNPVSDEYYGSSVGDQFLQTKFVGRIPCSTGVEASAAVDQIISYESTPPNLWNKRYMFVSGGFDSVETLRFGQFSDRLISQFIAPSPLAGLPSRLYRTITQITTSQETDEQKEIINKGAVWINYYGHGGTDTWGNGINSPDQLQNSDGKRHVISDISCSTARFAEPTIDSFGEEMFFGDAGGAIAYLGSAGFGFESPLQVMSQSLYQQISIDSVREMGQLLLGAKVSLWATGTGSVITQEALQQYTLLGDPALKLAVPKLPDYAISGDQIKSKPSIPVETDTSIVVSAVLSNFGLQGKDSVEVKVNHQFQNLTETVLDRRLGPIASLDTLALSAPSFSRGGIHRITIFVDPANNISEVSKANNTGEFSLFVNSASILPVLPLTSSTVHPDSVLFVVQNPGNPSMQSWKLSVEVDTSSSFLSPAHARMASIPQGVLSTNATFPLGTLKDSTLYYWRGRFESPGDSTNWVGGYFLTNKSNHDQWVQDRQSLFIKNSFDELAVSDTIRLDSHTSAVTAYSAGFSDGNSVLITVGSAALTQGFANRGYNVAVINQYSGKLETFGAFSIYSDAGDTTLSLPLITFINNIPQGRRVIMAVWDEGAKGKSEGLNQAIESCGSGKIRSLTFRGSWAMSGWKGAPIGSVPEAIKNSGAGPVTIRDTVLFQANIGSMVTPSIGPAARWKSFGISVDTTLPGTHVSVALIRLKNDGSTDTLRNVQPGQSLSSLLSPTTTASIQLRANLRSDSLGFSPRLTKWWVDYDPPPELAINYRSISLSADSLLQGTPVTAHVQVNNIGAGPADSVLLRTSFINLSNGARNIDSVIIPSITPNSTVTVDQVFQTVNHVGTNSILVQINPSSSIPELYQANNVFSVSLVVRSDTIRPSFTVTFDGSAIYNNDYVSSTPTILAHLSDSNALPITDPTSVVLVLDDRRVTLGGNADSLFAPANGSQNALVTFRPQLQSGEHVLSVQVSDVAGNVADTTAFRVTFRVETEPGLRDVYNYPNPFARETQFTFNLVGSKVPDQLRIKIYSLAGRLIQELTAWSSDLRIGFNRVSWNGRDREGDEVANGVYFYKIVMAVDGKTEEVIQKLAKVR